MFAVFLAIDVTLLSANMLKFLEGGWVPLAIAVVIFATMWTWMKGRAAVAAREKEGTLPIETLLGSISPGRVHRPQGTAVYLTAFSGNAPDCLLHNLKHNEVLHEHVVLLTIEVPDEPYVSADRAHEDHPSRQGRASRRLALRLHGAARRAARPRPARRPRRADRPDAHLLLRRPQQLLSAPPSPMLPRWQQKLFLVLARFAVSAADFFGLPANRVVELGSRIEI